MKLYIAIKDGKVKDITSNIIAMNFPEKDYFLIEGVVGVDIQIGDTWDYINECSLKDSIERVNKSEIRLKMEDLEERIKKLEEVKN